MKSSEFLNYLMAQKTTIDRLEPGEPCGHPGCERHLSHPCEKCGRFAAGLQNGPHVDLLWEEILDRQMYSAVIMDGIKRGLAMGWNREQILGTIVLSLDDALQAQAKEIFDYIERSVALYPVIARVLKDSEEDRFFTP